MKRKIKNWLIGKLGGIPATYRIKPIVIHTEPRDVVKIQVERAIPLFQINLMTPEEEADVVNRCLAGLLGHYLMDNGLVEISIEEKADRKIFYGSLRVVKGGVNDA